MSRVLALTGSLVLAVAAGSGALSRLLTSQFYPRALGVLAVVAVACLVTRLLARPAWLATIVGAAAGVVALTVAYVPSTALGGIIPTPDSFGIGAEMARAASDSLYSSLPPAPSVGGVGLLAALGIAGVYLVAEGLAFGVKVPAAAAASTLLLWLPALLLGSTAPGWVWVLAAAGILGVLAAGRPPLPELPPRRRPARPGVATASHLARLGSAGAVCLVAAFLLGAGVPALPALLPLDTLRGGVADPNGTRLSLELDMRASLGQQGSTELVRYRATDEVSLGPLRAYTTAEFDGRTWVRDDAADAAVRPLVPDELLWPEQVDPAQLGEADQVDIRIPELAQDRLLIPTSPRSVTVAGEWQYDPRSDEVFSASDARRAVTYSVTYLERPITADLLRNADPRRLPAENRYLQLPETQHAEDIGDLAREITDGAGSAYDEALALQSYLRDASRFTYTEDAPPVTSEDAVWDFLDSQQGYCVQFATTMVVLARHLDLPARLAIGFLPGARADDGSRIITGSQAHAWPELYFPGVGWVRFEPTPAVQSGVPPAYANPLQATASPGVAEPSGAVPPGVPTGVPTASGGATGAGGAAGADDGGRGELLVGATVVVLVGLAGALLWRRRRAWTAGTAESTWSQLLRRLARHSVTVPASATPRQAAERIAENLGEDAQNAATRLAHAVEVERYAPPRDGAPGRDDVHAWHEWAALILSRARQQRKDRTGRTSRRR
ncbi:transglutaminase domain protein [Beutenbergia cavernae DSM 12333]|uniref:Transglutaminase domain protein n=1 Tax=Beutenbergia cavernae (strain ATCC BAA-8 / DSM 12333 / CCUG 43141 / JCM 11478 / NBRC 16432 / NCIMB 13614 / HKI 0122) TaxID=471853 RepID=C5BW71_BEUC1|nr:DUF3488 and transglutaminase-like domain-containing protein [Beutenbergia cavernae]ACQ80672.1 transglutaminase domain protein [Beutenbergia cavernae DSM 12333]